MGIFNQLWATALLLVMIAIPAEAGVTMHDIVAVKGEVVVLKAVTRGTLFKKGGMRVEFFVDGRSLVKTLSGGDGAAFKEFVPKIARLYKIKAVSGTGKADAYVLSLKKGSRVLYIDVVGALLQSPFSKTPKEGSLEAVKELSKKHNIVYLGAMIPGRGFLSKWIREQGFPEGPMAAVKSVELHNRMGLKIHAVIGSKSVVEPILGVEPEGGKGVAEPPSLPGQEKERKPKKKGVKAFSFDKAIGAQKVKSWEEILKKL